MVSTTVTIAVAVEIFPLISVTVRATVLAPVSLHVNAVLSKTVLITLQLSVGFFAISISFIVAFPDASKYTVILLATTYGLMVSKTVTVEVPVEKLPLKSVTVNVTIFAPVSTHPKVVISRTKLAIPHKSLDPLSI